MPFSPSRATDVFTYSLSISICLKRKTPSKQFPTNRQSSPQASDAQLAGKEKPTTGCSPGFLFKTLYGRFLNLSATPTPHRSCRERRTSPSPLCLPGRRRERCPSRGGSACASRAELGALKRRQETRRWHGPSST